MIRALIADEQILIRAGLKSVLAATADIKVVAEANTAEEALHAICTEALDAVLLDLDLAGKAGYEILQEVRRLKPRLPVLILSLKTESVHAARLLKAGASGYIRKDCEPAEILQAVRRVAGGERYLVAQLAEQLYLQSEAGADQPLHACLTAREQEVLALIAAGRALTEIAMQLQISEKTVSTHRINMLDKMGLGSNAALIKYAVSNGLAN